MSVLALDLSKTSTGWAVYSDGADRPRVGHWRLGSEFTSDGQVFNKLLTCLKELRQVVRFDHVYYEQKINPAQLAGHTTIQTINLMSGLEAMVKTFAYAKRLRTCQGINVGNWRPDFIGAVEHSEAKRRARKLRDAGDKRASARKDLKDLTMERCRQLGFAPRNDDEADAIGILTYAILLRGETPPWLADETLRPLMTASAA